MVGLTDLLGTVLGGNARAQISRELGADANATSGAIQAALPVLLAALQRNSAAPEGADALHRALAQDHDGGILEDLGNFLGNAQAGPGAGILRHVLGARQEVATSAIAKASGLDGAQVTRLLTMLAPVVLGALGRAQRQQSLDAGGLSSLLQADSRQMASRSPDLMSLATRLLDQDQDGSIVDEIAGGFSKLFGKS
jgi:hypothetical protein